MTGTGLLIAVAVLYVAVGALIGLRVRREGRADGLPDAEATARAAAVALGWPGVLVWWQLKFFVTGERSWGGRRERR